MWLGNTESLQLGIAPQWVCESCVWRVACFAIAQGTCGFTTVHSSSAVLLCAVLWCVMLRRAVLCCLQVYLHEIAEQHRQGFLSSIGFASAISGCMLGVLVVLILELIFSPSQVGAADTVK